MRIFQLNNSRCLFTVYKVTGNDLWAIRFIMDSCLVEEMGGRKEWLDDIKESYEILKTDTIYDLLIKIAEDKFCKGISRIKVDTEMFTDVSKMCNVLKHLIFKPGEILEECNV